MLYNLLDGDLINKEYLTKDEDFLVDAEIFLTDRAGNEKDDLNW